MEASTLVLKNFRRHWYMALLALPEKVPVLIKLMVNLERL